MLNLTSIERIVAVLAVGAMLAVADRGVSASPSGQATPRTLDAQKPSPEPRLDTITVHGAERTREPVVVRAARLQSRQLLTSSVLARALRRLRDLPVASNAWVTFESTDGGPASLDLSIDERRVVPGGWVALSTIGARLLLRKELRFDVAGPFGAGELMSMAWRWQVPRPRVAVGLALPSPRGLPGIVLLDASWERQSYDATPLPDDDGLAREERRRVGIRLADWSAGWLRWQTGAALDRMRGFGDVDRLRFDAREHLAVESTVEVRLAADRIALAVSAGWWAPLGGGHRFGTGGVLAAWRSTTDAAVPRWSASTEFTVTSRDSPLALWEGAGTGQGRTRLLRAHPLLDGGLLRGEVFGRNVVNGTFEYSRPVGRLFKGGVSIAGFVDTAQAWHRLNSRDRSPLYLDAGIGVRVRAAGTGGGLRLDVARGLRGGGYRLSAGLTAAWPR